MSNCGAWGDLRWVDGIAHPDDDPHCCISLTGHDGKHNCRCGRRWEGSLSEKFVREYFPGYLT